MESKMSVDNIFRSMYRKVKEGVGFVPPNVDNAFLCTNLWESSERIPIKYVHYRWMVMHVLKLSGQERIVKESWRGLIASGYLIRKSDDKERVRDDEVEVHMKDDLTEIHRMEMRYIRPIIGIPEPVRDASSMPQGKGSMGEGCT